MNFSNLSSIELFLLLSWITMFIIIIFRIYNRSKLKDAGEIFIYIDPETKRPYMYIQLDKDIESLSRKQKWIVKVRETHKPPL